jgi:hypothetical protein
MVWKTALQSMLQHVLCQCCCASNPLLETISVDHLEAIPVSCLPQRHFREVWNQLDPSFVSSYSNPQHRPTAYAPFPMEKETLIQRWISISCVEAFPFHKSTATSTLPYCKTDNCLQIALELEENEPVLPVPFLARLVPLALDP